MGKATEIKTVLAGGELKYMVGSHTEARLFSRLDRTSKRLIPYINMRGREFAALNMEAGKAAIEQYLRSRHGAGVVIDYKCN
jgi:hypothetical protein